MASERWIVVGTDFSEGAQYALEQAAQLAGTSGARIALVHAYEHEGCGSHSTEDVASAFEAQLAEAIAHAGVNGDGSRVETFVRRGAPWEKLLNVAVDVGADLIVVGASGQRGAAGAGCLLGSVAYHLVAMATRSVLISRPPFDRGRIDPAR